MAAGPKDVEALRDAALLAHERANALFAQRDRLQAEMEARIAEVRREFAPALADVARSAEESRDAANRIALSIPYEARFKETPG